MRDAWRWMISDASLPVRIAVGICIFVVLAVVDYRRNRERATRWREYLFLLLCMIAAICYGIVNDLITSRISVEYFLFGKGVAERVGADVIAHPELHRGRLDLEAIRIGTLATWWMGLIVGTAILMTNSVGRRPVLIRRRLVRLLPMIAACAVGCAIVGGVIGASGWLARLSDEFALMVARDQMRPTRYMAVSGIHLGGYLGAFVGFVAACVLIWRRRGRLNAINSTDAAANSIA